MKGWKQASDGISKKFHLLWLLALRSSRLPPSILILTNNENHETKKNSNSKLEYSKIKKTTTSKNLPPKFQKTKQVNNLVGKHIKCIN